MCTADITYFIAESAAVDGSGYTRQLPAMTIYMYKGVGYVIIVTALFVGLQRVRTLLRQQSLYISYTHTFARVKRAFDASDSKTFRPSTSAAEGAETIRDDKIMNAPRRSPGT